jgi:hypothetical protein
MKVIRRIIRSAAVMAAAAMAFAACAAGPAFASLAPPPGGSQGAPAPAAVPGPVPVMGGMPGWEITAIAVVAALVAATLAVQVDRMRTGRAQVSTSAG